MTFLLSSFLCAVAFRLRGSELWDVWTHTGTIGGRVLWAVCVSFCLFVTGCSIWSLAVVPILFLSAVPGWPQSIDLGSNEGTWMRDFWMMAARGLLFTLPAGLLLSIFHSPWFLIFGFSGFLAGVMYTLGSKIPFKIKHLEQGPALGEALFGGLVGLSIATSAFLEVLVSAFTFR